MVRYFVDYCILRADVGWRCTFCIDRHRKVGDTRYWNSPFGNTSAIFEEKRIVFGLRTLQAKGVGEVYALLHTNPYNAHCKPLVWRELELRRS